MALPISAVHLTLLSTAVLADQCNLNNGMTDEVRDMFLKKHNDYRSEVARGLAKDGMGGFAPTAARMYKMSYDCKLEENMMRWLNRCINRPSYGINGENMWKSNDKSMSKIDAADMSTTEWFSELAINGVGAENELTSEVFNRGVKHYTQMVWQRTWKLGCGVKVCNKFLLVGCQYHKRGNVIGDEIYKVGEPCSKCKCKNCQCDTETGLCILQ
uniref:Cap-12 n=1 Tax=Haemonchus contortus TaxID=6289 RepID=A0A0K2DSG9_HAECO|nr:cap-12 [Haemonchus contortus]